MAKRKNSLTTPNRSQLLDEMRVFRYRLHDFRDGLAPTCDDFEALKELQAAIDLLAEKLTSDTEYYHAVSHGM